MFKSSTNKKYHLTSVPTLGVKTRVFGAPIVMDSPLKHKFDEKEENKNLFKNWVKTQVVAEVDGYKVRSFKDSDNSGNYVVTILDEEKEKVIYYAAFIVSTVFKKDLLSQTGLWKDRTYRSLRPDSIVFDYFLNAKDVDGVVTSSLQTVSGKNFWFKLVRLAFTKNLYVFFIDISSGLSYRVLNYDHFLALAQAESIWSDYDPASGDKHIVVSGENLWPATKSK